MNLVLCGPPFSGKSTVGKALSFKLNRPFIDADQMLEQNVGMSKSDFYRKVGEKEFRRWEHKVLHSLSARSNSVIALGGGMTDPDMKSLGSVFYLSVPEAVLMQRLMASGRSPAYLNVEDLHGSFLRLISKREKQFASIADYTIQANRPVNEILNDIGERYGFK